MATVAAGGESQVRIVHKNLLQHRPRHRRRDQSAERVPEPGGGATPPRPPADEGMQLPRVERSIVTDHA